MTTLFISDLHIGPRTPHVLVALRQLINHETPNADALYILGDLVDAWVGDDDDSQTAVELRKALSDATQNCPVYVMHGNRDFMLGEKFVADTGVHLIDAPHVITLNEQNILLSHGDEYCTRDKKYQRERTIIRSADWKTAMLSRSLSERREIAQSLRLNSIVTNANKTEQVMDVTPAAISDAMRKHDCHHMIHGHTHRPGIHEVSIDNSYTGLRYVLGNWERCGWLLRATESLQLECFPTT